MSTPFIGEIRMFAGNFAPVGWAICSGQLLAIAQYDALFALIGTIYGGDGQTTFALPDLRGRVPMHQGNNHLIGESGGQETVTLTINQIPNHSHVPQANAAGSATSPTGNVWANSAALQFAPNDSPPAPMNSSAIGTAGGNLPHDNRSPYLAIQFIIALEGIFPQSN